MKKNLISVIILALVFANFVLTALLIFTVLPETKKANELISAVCESIDLELNSGAATGLSSLPIEQITTYAVNDGESIICNLKASGDGGSSNHYAVLSISLSLNNEHENYQDKYSPEVLALKDDIIRDDIIRIISGYTKEEFDNNMSAVKEEILLDMQDMFGRDYVVGVNFSSVQTE
jgi:flagellar FliL protein